MVAARADDQLDARFGHRLHEEPTRVDPALRASAISPSAAARTASSPRTSRRTSPRSSCAPGGGVDLDDDRCPPSGRAASTAASASRTATAGVTASPACRSTRGCPARERPGGVGWRSGGRVEPEDRRSRPGGPARRHGPPARRAARVAASAPWSDRPEGLIGAAKDWGAPPCSSRTAFVSGGGSPEVSETYTGRMCGRSRVESSSARVTSSAVSTSAGIDL